jgi:hypothetical protein
MDSVKYYSYEFTEKIIFEKLEDNDIAKKTDTTIARVTVKEGKEIARKILHSTDESKEKSSNDKKGENADDKEMSVGAEIDFSPNNPDYSFALIDSSGPSYVVSIIPKKARPDKDQINGTFHLDKQSFLATRMDFSIPRPTDAKELTMLMNFTRLPNGPYVITDMMVKGKASALLGLIKIKFRVTGAFSDYVVLPNVNSR